MSMRALPVHKSALAVVLSICQFVAVAFFPKCPLCLVPYLAVFGAVGLLDYASARTLYVLSGAILITSLFTLGHSLVSQHVQRTRSCCRKEILN
jgi:hypothetical protein